MPASNKTRREQRRVWRARHIILEVLAANDQLWRDYTDAVRREMPISDSAGAYAFWQRIDTTIPAPDRDPQRLDALQRAREAQNTQQRELLKGESDGVAVGMPAAGTRH